VACTDPDLGYTFAMSANDLLEKVKSLSPRERRKFLQKVHELENGFAVQKTTQRKKPIHWPDAAARRRKIFGDKVLPNLVLLAREEERF
jgi:hypothetical protein